MAIHELADEYFNRSYETVASTPLEHLPVCYAVFCRERGRLCGITDVLGLLNGRCQEPITVRSRLDGYRYEPNEIVMTIEGSFGELVTLETEYLGMLSLSGAASNMARLAEAAGDAQVIDMAARHYPPEIAEVIAVAAAVGGAAGTSTRLGHQGVHERFSVGEDRIQIGAELPRPFELYGTIPHSLNAAYGGSSIESAAAYHEHFPDLPLTVLLDFEGRERDICAEAVKRFGSELYAVRLDTGGERIHQGGHDKPVRALEMRILSAASDRQAAQAALDRYGFGPGVTIEAAYAIRDLLDSLGAKSTKLILSSGFDLEKIEAFKACNAPMDAIGTGSWVRFAMFTSDIVRVYQDGNWISRCKAGRFESLIEPSLPVIFAKNHPGQEAAPEPGGSSELSPAAPDTGLEIESTNSGLDASPDVI